MRKGDDGVWRQDLWERAPKYVTWKDILDAIDELPRRDRSVILCLISGDSRRAAMERTGLTKAQLETRRRRAVARLRRRLFGEPSRPVRGCAESRGKVQQLQREIDEFKSATQRTYYRGVQEEYSRELRENELTLLRKLGLIVA